MADLWVERLGRIVLFSIHGIQFSNRWKTVIVVVSGNIGQVSALNWCCWCCLVAIGWVLVTENFIIMSKYLISLYFLSQLKSCSFKKIHFPSFKYDSRYTFQAAHLTQQICFNLLILLNKYFQSIHSTQQICFNLLIWTNFLHFLNSFFYFFTCPNSCNYAKKKFFIGGGVSPIDH